MPIKHGISSNTLKIIRRLHDAGYDAYVVGGAVRDLLLDIDPKDYDLSTNATPEQVKEVFGRKAMIIGRRFRLVHVRMGPELFEVSTFRREPTEEERKGRNEDSGLMVWRDNEFGTVEQDASRRDFTVNAIFYDPLRADHEVLDFVGGVADIENCVVRTIGDPRTRMLEDPVRMLRACKLVAQYDFKLEPKLRTAIIDEAHRLADSSSARLIEEFFKIAQKPHCASTLTCMRELRLLKFFLPVLDEAWDHPVGDECVKMLAARDSLLAAGEIYPSRATALSCLFLPLFCEYMDCEEGTCWRSFMGIDKELSRWLRKQMQPYSVPKHLIAKTRDALMILAKIVHGKENRRGRKQLQDSRARDTLLAYQTAFGKKLRPSEDFMEGEGDFSEQSEH
jgi:poly(A) polymerase